MIPMAATHSRWMFLTLFVLCFGVNAQALDPPKDDATLNASLRPRTIGSAAVQSRNELAD